MAYGDSYGMARVNKSFLEDMMAKSQGEEKSLSATNKQKKEMQAKFQAELEAAQAKARKKSKKFGGLGKILDIVGMGLGPLGSGLTGGIKALIEGSQARKGAKSLMSGVDSGRWGKTFLSEGMDEYKKEVDDSQMSIGDMLSGALMSGVGSFAMSKAGGAEKGEGFLHDMFKPGDVVKEGATNIGFAPGGKAATDASTKVGAKSGIEMFGEKSSNFDALPGKGAISTDYLSPKGTARGEGFLPKKSGNFDVFGKDKILGGMPQQTTRGGDITPFKNLIKSGKDSFKQMTGDFSEDGLKGMDYQEMMKIMNLMQKFGGNL